MFFTVGWVEGKGEKRERERERERGISSPSTPETEKEKKRQRERDLALWWSVSPFPSHLLPSTFFVAYGEGGMCVCARTELPTLQQNVTVTFVYAYNSQKSGVFCPSSPEFGMPNASGLLLCICVAGWQHCAALSDVAALIIAFIIGERKQNGKGRKGVEKRGGCSFFLSYCWYLVCT